MPRHQQNDDNQQGENDMEGQRKGDRDDHIIGGIFERKIPLWPVVAAAVSVVFSIIVQAVTLMNKMDQFGRIQEATAAKIEAMSAQLNSKDIKDATQDLELKNLDRRLLRIESSGNNERGR